MKRTAVIGTILFAGALVTLGSGIAMATNHAEKADSQKAIIRTNVQVAMVTQMGIPTTVFSVGRLVAIKSAQLSSEVDGRISTIFFQNGDYVHKGQPIIQLDDAKAKADLYSAQAAYRLSQTTYARYQALIKEGGVSQQTLDQQKSALESNEAAVKMRMASLQQKTITAPFSGVLSVFNVTSGAYVSSGQALVKLVDKQKLRVQYTIPQKYLALLKLGQVVSVKSNSYPTKTFSGEVSYIAPSVNEDTGSVTIQATIENHKNLLSPGMFVTINQIVQEDPDALVIPEQSIVASLQGHHVFVVKNGIARAIKIKIGERRNGFAQVKKGLKLGEKIVIAGQQKIHDGSLVKIVPLPVEGSFIESVNFSKLSNMERPPKVRVGAKG